MNQSRVNASISPSFPRIGKRTFGISSLGKVFLGLLLLFAVPGKGRAETLQGTAIDPRRSPVPRATVRLLDAAGAEVARTLTDDQGRFHFEGLAGTTYTVEVSLTGFETASAKAAPGQQVKIVLPVAPVRESVIVTATRTEAPTSQLGASTSVIPESEIRDRQAAFVSDLFQSVPGATVVRTGGLGALTSAFVRGGNSDYNKVLLDGIPLNEPGGFFNFNNFTVENLERVEVVRGPQSALFGSDAMTGVIQLFTRRGQSPGVSFPRVLGIEATGLVESAPGGEFQKDDVVATAMGGMGRCVSLSSTRLKARQMRAALSQAAAQGGGVG